jgi:uncharacterized protein (DUF58 family)
LPAADFQGHLGSRSNPDVPSASDDGTGSKLEYVQFLATALAHVISQGHDQVALALLADDLRDVVPPGGTLTHVARVQELIEQLETRPTVRLGPGLQQFFLRSRSRGVLLLMNDFLVEDLADVFAAVQLFRHRQWEVVVLHVIHPDEERLPRTWRPSERMPRPTAAITAACRRPCRICRRWEDS